MYLDTEQALWAQPGSPQGKEHIGFWYAWWGGYTAQTYAM